MPGFCDCTRCCRYFYVACYFFDGMPFVLFDAYGLIDWNLNAVIIENNTGFKKINDFY